MKTLLRSVLLACVLLLMLPGPALADGPEDGKLIFGGTYILAQGETLNGDLVVVGGTVTVEEGAQVNGNVALVGGSVTIDGTVNGDAVAVGGTLSLGPKSVVTRDVGTFGAMLNRAEGSQVAGQVTSGGGFQMPFTLPVPSTVPQPWNLPGTEAWNVPFAWRFDTSPLLNGASIFLRSLGLAALAVLVVIFWPGQVARVAHASLRHAPLSGALGLLTGVVAPGLLILLAITLCLIPVAALGAVLLLVAIVFGWIAIGAEVGNRLAEDLFHLFRGEGNGPGPRPDEPRHLRGAADEVPRFICQLHLDQDISGIELLGADPLLALADLHDLLHGHHDPGDVILQAEDLGALLDRRRDLVLEPRVGVHDEPLLGAGLVGHFRITPTIRASPRSATQRKTAITPVTTSTTAVPTLARRAALLPFVASS